jgi:YfiH family protein
MELQVFSVSRSVGSVALPLLVSGRIPAGFRYGFTTRQGGVSAPPFDSLNLGWKWGDARASVDENHRRLLAVSGASVMLRASQVHGIRILRVAHGDDPLAVAAEQADGLVTDDPGLGISIHVADCTPILMACPRTGACAALHAGWRSTVAGMARAGVAAMFSNFGCSPQDLRVALGPCIGACCFEVGSEVVDAFVKAMPAARSNGVVLTMPGGASHIDLRTFQRLEFESAGVLPENIDTSTDCTRCDPDHRFFSFRAAGRATGQSVGFIVRR